MKASLFLPIVFLSGCTLGPDFSLPGFDAGKNFKQPTSSRATRIPDAWWTLFDDPELTRLTNKAIAANNDLAAARARRNTARALTGVDRARLFPQLDLNSGNGINRASSDNIFPVVDLETQNYRTSFDLAYEVDLWGGNRRSIQAAEAEAGAADSLLAAQRLGIASEVARQYFLLRGLDSQQAVLNDTIASRQESFTLESSRTNAGLTDGIGTTRARTEVELAKNDLANVQRQRGAAEHALAVLCGSRPAGFSVSNKITIPKLPEIQAGLPAEVIARRPDMRAAERKLRAENARIGVAQAALYPKISLTGSAGLESLSASSFLDWQSRVLSLGAGIAGPLFDSGANRANYNASRSKYEESLSAYRQTMLVALREVEDALVDIKGFARSRNALEAALASSLDTRNLASERYEKGLSSYLEVVDAERSILNIRLTLAELHAQQRISLTSLAQALGGGWNGI